MENNEKISKTIKMPIDLVEQIEKLAKDKERNFSTQTIYMLRRYINMMNIDKE